MNKIEKIDQFESYFEQIRALIKERDDLREEILKRPISKPDKSEVTVILKSALNNESGWREKARQILGLYRMIKCEMCGSPFPSGGKRKKHCGGCQG